MQQRQYFSIAPNGIVRGGNASYVADLVTGAIAYEIEVILPLWQTKKASGYCQVDPSYFKSDKFKKAGDLLKIGNANFYCSSMGPSTVFVLITIDNSKMTGHATFDKTGDFLEITSLQASGNAMSFAFDLLFTPKP